MEGCKAREAHGGEAKPRPGIRKYNLRRGDQLVARWYSDDKADMQFNGVTHLLNASDVVVTRESDRGKVICRLKIDGKQFVYTAVEKDPCTRARGKRGMHRAARGQKR